MPKAHRPPDNHPWRGGYKGLNVAGKERKAARKGWRIAKVLHRIDNGNPYLKSVKYNK